MPNSSRSIKVTREELGEPIYDKNFKRMLRHNRSRCIYLSVDNGSSGPMGIYLTIEETNKLIFDLLNIVEKIRK